MDTTQNTIPLPTEDEYLKGMIRVWRGRKNPAVASRDARAPAAKQHEASGPQQAQGKNAPSVTSQRAKNLQWRPKNTPRVEKNDIIVVLKPRETLDLKATFGPGQAGAAVRSILGADASVGLAVWPIWDQNVLVCPLRSVDYSGTLRCRSRAASYPSGDIPNSPPGCCTSCGVQVPATPDGPTEYQCIPSCLLCSGGHKTGASGCAGRFWQPVKPRSPRGSKPKTTGGHEQAPTAKTVPEKAPAAESNKPEPKKTHIGRSTNVKPGTPSEPPVLVKDFPPLTPVQTQVSCWGEAVSGPSPSPSPTETALQQQIGELRRQNQVLARKNQELEAKMVGSPEPMQEAEADDGDDGSSVTSHLTSVSRQDADTVVGPASTTGPIGRLESPERKTEQLGARVAALPTQIMWAVRESFQDMFTAALTQALPDIAGSACVTHSRIGPSSAWVISTLQVSNSILKAVEPWLSTQIKNTTQCDSPQLKRKPASRQAAEESFLGSAPGGPARLLTAAAPPPGPDRSPAP
ncbi:hypothetical protein HPB50_013250 [Hyalomma asiaticum]|uniref:Uncharacterized protein n=1 Tax=Hyalomma asiaticum TaxID=266040 RepID=A0ACB7RTF6_HYAAI|nr:hypothetical protein HPB50_013250 [Hyalomma asiaticum]